MRKERRRGGRGEEAEGGGRGEREERRKGGREEEGGEGGEGRGKREGEGGKLGGEEEMVDDIPG